MQGSLAIGGKTVQIGHTIGKTSIDMYSYQFNAGSISGSNGQSGQGIYSDVIALMASGRIDMRKMVTGRIPLADMPRGLELSGARSAGKILVNPN